MLSFPIIGSLPRISSLLLLPTWRHAIGDLATSAEVGDRDQQLGVVVLALCLDVMKFFIPEFGGRLAGKIVVDPSNPVGPDGKGGIERTFAVTTFYET